MLKGKTIILGVTGCIAAYKAAEIVRGLKKLNADVWVAMTPEAAKLVRQPLGQHRDHTVHRVDARGPLERLAILLDPLSGNPAECRIHHLLGEMDDAIQEDLIAYFDYATERGFFEAPIPSDVFYDDWR